MAPEQDDMTRSSVSSAVTGNIDLETATRTQLMIEVNDTTLTTHTRMQPLLTLLTHAIPYLDEKLSFQVLHRLAVAVFTLRTTGKRKFYCTTYVLK